MDNWKANNWKDVYRPASVGCPCHKIATVAIVLLALACLSALANWATTVQFFSQPNQPTHVETLIISPTTISPTPTLTPATFVAPDCVACEPYGLPIILAQGQKLEITCRFHDPDRPGHSGADFSIEVKTEVIATMDGWVRFAGDDPVYGKLVILQNESWETWYAHNAYLLVRADDWVKQGEVMALSGNTGASSGPHLHYGVKDLVIGWLDPVNTFGGQIMQVEFGEFVQEVR